MRRRHQTLWLQQTPCPWTLNSIPHRRFSYSNPLSRWCRQRPTVMDGHLTSPSPTSEYVATPLLSFTEPLRLSLIDHEDSQYLHRSCRHEPDMLLFTPRAPLRVIAISTPSLNTNVARYVHGASGIRHSSLVHRGVLPIIPLLQTTSRIRHRRVAYFRPSLP